MEEFGYILLSDEELSEKVGISVQTIKKHHKALIEKGVLEIIEVDGKKIKKFNLNKLSK